MLSRWRATSAVRRRTGSGYEALRLGRSHGVIQDVSYRYPLQPLGCRLQVAGDA